MSKIIGIIGAMDIEVDGIVADMKNTSKELVGAMCFIKGELFGKEVVVCRCGIGKVFAGICTQAMILKYNPCFIINSGVAGALSSELSILDAVIATSVVQHDMDTSALGDPVGLISGINVINIDSDKTISNALKNVSIGLGINTVDGIVASGDQFVANTDKKKSVSATFGAIACEMEGAAIGQTCFVNNVPFAIIRTISDGKGEAMDYFTFSKIAAEQAIKIIKKFVESYEG
ncbi:MAG: 5'-methylthioadenosine/adenosylhomocysteine nucleosidase [Clostridia bacterium]|nr:5'-methylthioadenosine/adenosylhomocysteine nucleosidase [Clostridia bacterium]